MKKIILFLLKPIIFLSVLLSLVSMKGKAYDSVANDLHATKQSFSYTSYFSKNPRWTISFEQNVEKKKLVYQSLPYYVIHFSNNRYFLNTCHYWTDLKKINNNIQINPFLVLQKSYQRVLVPISADDPYLI